MMTVSLFIRRNSLETCVSIRFWPANISEPLVAYPQLRAPLRDVEKIDCGEPHRNRLCSL